MTVELYDESPLAAHADVLAQHATPRSPRIAEVAFTAQVSLRVDPKGPAAERIGTALGAMLPNQPGQVVRTHRLLILWLGPDEWLLVGPRGTAQDIADTLNSALDDEHGAVADTSAHRTIVEVSGPNTRQLLSKGCALDLHPRSFGANRCAQTLLARAGVVMVCRDAETPTFWLFVRSSYARYLADWLTDAAAEYRS